MAQNATGDDSTPTHTVVVKNLGDIDSIDTTRETTSFVDVYRYI